MMIKNDERLKQAKSATADDIVDFVEETFWSKKLINKKY